MTEIAEIIRRSNRTARNQRKERTNRELMRQFDAVIMIVSDVFIVDEADILSKRQGCRFVADARHAAYSLMYSLIGVGHRRIGNFFGRGHDGIEYGCDICQVKRERPDYNENYNTCERLLKDIL